MRKFRQFVAFLLICAFLMVSILNCSLNVSATADTSQSVSSTDKTTESTTATTASTTATTIAPANGVQITQVFCYGSNNKLYNQLIKYSKLSEQYTANVSIPQWMTSCQINIKSVNGAKVSCDGTEFSVNGNVFTHTFTFDAATKTKKNTYKISIKKDDKESILTFNLTQTVFETKLESILVDSKATEGSNENGYKITLPTGTSTCKIKLRTRSEESVSFAKKGEELEKLDLNEEKVYLEKVELSEGENVFNITVNAPGTSISTTLTIMVGEEVVSSDVVSVPVVENITDTDISDTDIPPAATESEEPEISSVVTPQEPSKGGTSPLIWVLIGVVIAVVIGACIFMIASMGGSGSKNSRPANYGRQYNNYPYRVAPPPLPVRRRDLGRFVEEDYGYDEYYEDQSEDDFYQDDGYYSEEGFYDDYNRQGSYERQQPQRQQYQSQRRGNRNDFDDFYDDYYN